MTDLVLDLDDLRAVAAFAADCAADVLDLFEQHHPADGRPRTAIETTRAFALGGKRVKALRDAAWAALKAAQAAENPAAEQAARAAMSAASAPWLHPLPNATQVKHILGAAAHAARALELAAGNAPAVAADYLARAARRASPQVVGVLRRYPPAPAAGGRVGELLRSLDHALRGPADG